MFVPLYGQGNYEIQVYPSETQAPGTTMIELHSNFTIEGSKGIVDGVYGTEHQLHETVEITEGITDWFETGFYIFTSANPNQGGWQWVGDHIRPRVRVPEQWHWPVGVSLSLEFGYQRYAFSPDTWTLEIRPIIDKQIGYDITKKINAGFEYYGVLGPLGNFDLLQNQEQAIFPVVDLNLSPKWEFNFGVGVGMTGATDHLIVKMILGRRFGKTKASTD
jgi:hypothetical protein